MPNVDYAVRDAVSVAAPPLPMDAIRARGRRIEERGRSRRNLLAIAVLLLSLAGIAFAGGRPSGNLAHAPVPIASIRPAPAVT